MADTPEVTAANNTNPIDHFQETVSYDGEIVRQQLTVAMMTTILLNETVTVEARESALKELRLGSEYPTLQWRSLQMYAQHIVKQHRTRQASNSQVSLIPGLTPSATQNNQWYVDNPNIN